MVHIIDGHTHAVLHAVDLAAHAMTSALSQLHWSPDGVRLAVRTPKHIHLLNVGSIILKSGWTGLVRQRSQLHLCRHVSIFVGYATPTVTS